MLHTFNRALRRPVPSAIVLTLGIGLCLMAQAHPAPLTVGWHDEFNKLDDWAPWTGGSFDVLRGDVGKLTVVLGKSSMYMQVFKDYRAGVYRDIDVDLDHYPIVAVRAVGFQKAGQWDVQVMQYREPNAPDSRDVSKGGGIPIPGNPQRLAADLVGESKGHKGPDLVFMEVKALPSARGKKHVRLMLNLSGPQQQGYVEFAWVRFIRKEDVRRLRANPRLSDIRMAE
jgi:hypothetical protein